MTATAAEIRRVRRMTGETTSETYSDADMGEHIELYPVLDVLGNSPWVVSETDPTVLEVNPDWTATYDLNAAAADIWAEKAASLVEKYDFATQGQSFTRSQAYANAMAQSRYYRARRVASTVRSRPEPKPPTDDGDLSN